ncbi:DUF296 domain-containing protein [Candidatus Woesebacteria bacterium]|nr:DUF296 domain-containing protein [Candidatus Woesebacteria bacterium]
MKYQKQKDNTYVIRIERGEEIVNSLTKFCKSNKIGGGFFFGVGAVGKLTLAHYSVGKKKYNEKKFNEPLEMASLNGSVGVEKDLIIHAHGVFADKNMQTVAGHVVSARVSGTAEIYLIKLPKLKKIYDPGTGLKIFDL